MIMCAYPRVSQNHLMTGSDIAVLCANADPSEATATASALADRADELSPSHVESIAEVKTLLAEQSVDCVVSEYELADGTGFELFSHVRQVAPDTVCILFTDRTLEEIPREERGEVPIDYLHKDGSGPYRPLAARIEHSVRQRTHTAYPLPEDEPARLDALADYYPFDADEQDAFDQLAELAATFFDAPLAYIGLIDAHKQRFVASYGFDAIGAPAVESAPRQEGACTYTILEDDVMVVEDIREDPRVKSVETYQQLGIRWYAGAQLRTPTGHCIGTLCVLDTEPRSFSESQERHLRQFAARAMDQLELCRHLSASDSTASAPHDTGTEEGA